MKTIIYKWVLMVLYTLLIGSLLVSCNKKTTPNVIKSNESFYINDYADVLLNATLWTLLDYSIELYDDSSVQEYQDLNIDGAQIVVLTYQGQLGDINTTEIFNSWGIGKNDLGLLIVLFFDSEKNYQELVVEIGDKTSEYLSAFEASNMVDTYFNNPDINPLDIDLRLISLYFAYVEFFYMNIYDYDSYDYQSFYDEYLENQYTYFGKLPTENDDFFYNMPIWLWIIIIIFLPNAFIPLVFISSGRGFRISGGGGRSRGYWFKKNRFYKRLFIYHILRMDHRYHSQLFLFS